MFNRWIENTIKNDLAQKKSVLLLGSRRVGKTTLCKAIGQETSVYYTFDDVDLQSVCKKNSSSILNICNKEKINIFDEVQKAPEILDTVKLLIDDGYIFILTGSSALNLKYTTNETLAGRVRLRYLHPLCWGEEMYPIEFIPEISNFVNNIKSGRDGLLLKKGVREYENGLMFGGYPELANKEANEKKQILKDYKNTYLQRDILELSNIQDLDGFRAMLAALAQSIGSTVNYQHLAQESGLSHVTVKKYLHVLEETYIVFKLYPYQFGPAKRYIKSPKWYFSDNGMLNSLNIRLSEGQLFENFVVSEIHKRLRLANLDPDSFFFYKNAKMSEIDVVIEHENNVYLFEIKATLYTHTKFLRQIKSFTNKYSKDKSIRSFIIYKGEDFIQHELAAFVPVYSLFGVI